MSSHIEHESMENYLETIHKLVSRAEHVRSVDVSKELNLSRPSVSRAIRILKERNLVTVSEEGYISLTDEGHTIADRVLHIHTCLVTFLTDTAGISPEQAGVDACRIEHVVSDETVKGIENYIKEHQLKSVVVDDEISSHFPDFAELLESGENYLESILMIRKTKNWIRSVDLARLLNVSRASVSRAVNVLKQKGYLEIGDGNELILTPKGEEVAKKIYGRHLHLEAFLKFTLGISDEVADRDACRIEHMISEPALSGIKKYLKNNGIKVKVR